MPNLATNPNAYCVQSDMGVLRVDLLDGQNVRGVDRSGKKFATAERSASH